MKDASKQMSPMPNSVVTIQFEAINQVGYACAGSGDS
jgi:hypothetical protein